MRLQSGDEVDSPFIVAAQQKNLVARVHARATEADVRLSTRRVSRSDLRTSPASIQPTDAQSRREIERSLQRQLRFIVSASTLARWHSDGTRRCELQENQGIS
jgi:hypothetical protein